MAECKNCEDYMGKMHVALCNNYGNLRKIYDGKDGALRLAREFGYGIPDSPREQWDNVIQSSYSYLCVRFYMLKPPINAKEWVGEIWKSIDKRMQE